MSLRHFLRIVLLALTFALATWLLGWWAVPTLAFLWGAIQHGKDRSAVAASAGAGLGWALMLLWTASEGPLLELANRASGVLATTGGILVAVTILFPMLLAWPAAVLGESLTNLYLSRQQER